ncbi:MAG: hypothetical protein ACHQ9S_17075 [Candidatus Binatia bacterium]
MIKIIKYLFESALLVASALPAFAPRRFHYLEKRISKFCMIGAFAVLALSIIDDVASFRETEALTARVAAAEKAARPVPLATRLRGLLEEIDPKIIPALKAGQTGFEGGITSSQFNRLQTMAKEIGAKEFITIDPGSVRMGIGMGPEGVQYNVAFTLGSKLLQEP